MEQSSAPQETSISDLFVPDVAPVTQTVAPSNAPVEQVPAQVTAPVVEAPKQTPTVPLPEHLDVRHRAQYAEKERDLARQEAELYRRQLDQYQRSIEAQRPQPQPIDPVADPEGAYRALQIQLQEQAIHQRANTSEMMARNNPVYGSKVDEAVAEAVKSGLNRHFMQQPDPYRALMDWHTSRNVAQQVGPDLNAYRQKVREEIIAEMKAGQGQRPTAPQNLPPSLSNATNANNSVPVVKESSDFFKEMFAKPRT